MWHLNNDTQNKNRIEYKNDKWFYINIDNTVYIGYYVYQGYVYESFTQ